MGLPLGKVARWHIFSEFPTELASHGQSQRFRATQTSVPAGILGAACEALFLIFSFNFGADRQMTSIIKKIQSIKMLIIIKTFKEMAKILKA